MHFRTLLVAVLSAAVGVGVAAQQPDVPSAAPAAPAADAPRPLHVYIRAGLKSHGEGLHDYPQFLADWSKILTEHGAIVDGSLHFPDARELANVDVLVMYKGDAGYMTADEKAAMETFVKRGGGLVSIHDTLCGDDPAYTATLLGGGKKHGEVNYSAGDIKYTIVDTASPIMKGLSDFTINDEAFFKMTWASDPKIHVLATAPMPASGEVVPQIWTYEHTIFGGQPSRAFVWMQGHRYANFVNPSVEPMLLRGIAWAARAPIDTLVNGTAPVRGGGGRQGGRGRGRAGDAPTGGAGAGRAGRAQ
jgi:type 1 glutamine amidotransferase